MSTFELQIVTPDGQFFSGEAARLSVRGIEGDLCILPRHIAFVTAIATGEARVTIDDKVRRAACSGGMVTVMKNHVRLVATTFEWEENIDKERAIRARERAEQVLKDAKDAQEISVAKAKLSRALVRIQVSQ
ncbi:MAG: ATP synthase F1 subunit epsilon [Ruthenibacterium sp.]